MMDTFLLTYLGIGFHAQELRYDDKRVILCFRSMVQQHSILLPFILVCCSPQYHVLQTCERGWENCLQVESLSLCWNCPPSGEHGLWPASLASFMPVCFLPYHVTAQKPSVELVFLVSGSRPLRLQYKQNTSRTFLTSTKVITGVGTNCCHRIAFVLP